MKKLAVGISCYPTYGGSGVIATEVGMELARRGHRVHIMSYDVPMRLDRFMQNIFFHEVDVLSYPLFEYPPYCLALASEMVRVCKQEKLDILHVHYAIPHAISAYLATEILGKEAPKIITTLHGTDITLVGNERSYLPITKLSIERSHGVTAVSQFLKQATYEELGLSKKIDIEVVPNFINLDDFTFKPERKRTVRKSLCQTLGKSREKIITHVSNFRPVKRVSDVIKVFARVLKEVNCRLVLVGDGPERTKVESLCNELGIEKKVIFLGKQSSIYEVLSCSDLFLLPSQTESFGLTALEAMACSIPVIATNVGGLPEVVVEGKTGFLFEVGDVHGMAQKAIEILSNPEQQRRLGKAARAVVEKEFQIGPVVDQYEAYYSRILRRK